MLRRVWMIAAVFAATGTPAVAGVSGPTGPNVAFVTSTIGTGDLGDSTEWPENDGLTGLEAADAVCRNRALAAGLAEWWTFRAWMSDQLNDAWCRAHGLDGTRPGVCGQAQLPDDAGPWVRVDGLPWAATIAEAVGDNGNGANGVVLRPLLDELGRPHLGGMAEPTVWTGTTWQGVSSSHHCGSWTNPNGTGTYGKAGTFGPEYFGSGQGGICTARRALLCLQTGAGPELPQEAATGRLAFRTWRAGNGDLGGWSLLSGHPDAPVGLAAGDAICRTSASAAGLPYADSFKAWLSTDTFDAPDRFVTDGPWRRVDGVHVADGLSDLTDGGVVAGVTVDERGEFWSWPVFTGTAADGRGTPDNCANWYEGTGVALGTIGYGAAAYDLWSDHGSQLYPCSFPLSIYCLSDSPKSVTWWDLFESGDLTWWSDVVQ